jgi:uncharacterized protein YukE
MTDITGSRISVPPDLGESGPQVTAIANEIGAEITDLQTRLSPLADYWSGTAASGHQVTQQQWNTAAQNLMGDVGTLGALAQAMGVNWNNYVENEGVNTHMWQH